MRLMSYWVVLCGGLLVLTGSGCTVKQQQEVLGGIGSLIPGSRNFLHRIRHGAKRQADNNNRVHSNA